MEPQASIVESDGQVDASPDVAPESPKPRRRKLLVTLIVVGVLATLGIATGAGLLVARLARAGSEVTGEWEQRIAKDYPEWKMVGFNFRSFSGSSGSQTDYTISVVPPGRDFAVGVVYVSRNDGEAACKDEVLRPGGLYSTRSEALLDYIESNYVADGKGVSSVITERDGSVTVSWLRVKNYWVFSSRVGSFDVLEYDSDTDTWDVAFSPDTF